MPEPGLGRAPWSPSARGTGRRGRGGATWAGRWPLVAAGVGPCPLVSAGAGPCPLVAAGGRVAAPLLAASGRAGAAGRRQCGPGPLVAVGAGPDAAGRRLCRCGPRGGPMSGTGPGGRRRSGGRRPSGDHRGRRHGPARHRLGVGSGPDRPHRVGRRGGGFRRQRHPRVGGFGTQRLRRDDGPRACDRCSLTTAGRRHSTKECGVCPRGEAPLRPVPIEKPAVRRTCRRRPKGGGEA